MATIKTATSLSSLRSAATELKKHLAKADTNRDGSVTTAEVKKYAKTLPNSKAMENALVTLTSYALNAQGGTSTKVKVTGVTKKVDDVLTSIKTRDANKNGKIDLGGELTKANSLKTFQALAELANARAAVTTKLTTTQLGAAMKPFLKDANYTSESDYAPIFVSGTLPAGKSLTGPVVMEALKKPIGDFMKADFDISGMFKNGSLADGAIEEVRDVKGFIQRLEDRGDGSDFEIKSAAAFTKLNALMKQNLTDTKLFYFGQKDAQNPNEVDHSPGLCCYLLVGKSSDGKVVGMLLGAVHT